MKFWLKVYLEGLKEYFQTLLPVVVTALPLVGEPTWPRKIFFCVLFNLIFSALVAGIVYCRNQLDKKFGGNKDLGGDGK